MTILMMTGETMTTILVMMRGSNNDSDDVEVKQWATAGPSHTKVTGPSHTQATAHGPFHTQAIAGPSDFHLNLSFY